MAGIIARPSRTIPFLRQVMVSVTATVVATALLTGLKHGYDGKAATDLTQTGKFSARVEMVADTPEPPRIVLPEPRLPALLATADMTTAPQAAEITAPAPVSPKALRRTARVETRRHTPAEASRGVQPPRRADFVLDAAALGTVPAEGEAGLWTAAKGLAAQAVAIGGTALDRLNPMRLLP